MKIQQYFIILAFIIVGVFAALMWLTFSIRPVIFYVTEGKMSVLQTGKVLHELEKGDAVYIRKGEYHEVRNDMNSELTFVVITFFE